MPGLPTYVVDMHHSKRHRIRLCCLPSKRRCCSCVLWGWSLYIVESESDPLTRRPVDLFEKEPLKGNSEVHLHTPTKFGEDPSKDLGGDREHTHKRCSNYSMIHCTHLYLGLEFTCIWDGKYDNCSTNTETVLFLAYWLESSWLTMARLKLQQWGNNLDQQNSFLLKRANIVAVGFGNSYCHHIWLCCSST